ncbi:MAG: SAM-dependent methyltransferase [Micromonosporaceae bacterium]
MTLPPEPQAAGIARRVMREALHTWNLAHLGDTAILLVSERVGNAIRHARATTPGLELRLATDGTQLRIEVLDQDPRAPTVRHPSELDESGYGLVLVQALADQWGVRELAIGKSVWAELRTLTQSGHPNHPPNGRSNGKPREAPMTNLPNPAHRFRKPVARRPNVARMFDCYLGGKDNFAADRNAAQQVLAVAPDVPRAAKEHRAFLTRAIQFLATETGIGQFIDIGPGLPTGHNVHDLAHRYDKTARVCYVDNDPGVLIHGHALLAGTHPGVTMIEGDLREPEKILANRELRHLIDLSQPVALCLTLVLQFVPDSDGPHDLIARLLEPLARGSYLIVSHVTRDAKDPEAVTQVTQAYEKASAPLVMRSRDEIKRFFGECALVPPEVVYLTQWYRCVTPTPVLGDGGTRWAYAGVGMK